VPVTFGEIHVGDILRIPAPGATCTVESPSEVIVVIPVPYGYADVWFAEAGTWTVDGEPFVVLPQPTAGDARAPLAELVVRGPGPRSRRMQAGEAFVLKQTYRDPESLVYVDPDVVRFRVWKEGWNSPVVLDSVQVSVGVYEGYGTVEVGGDHHFEVRATGAWNAVTRTTIGVDGAFFPV
jgi:hypothetical protein